MASPPTLREVASDDSIAPHETDHPVWPRSPAVNCLRHLLLKGVPKAVPSPAPSNSDPPDLPNPPSPALCSPTPPDPLTRPLPSPTAHPRIRFASADGTRNPRYTSSPRAFIPETASERSPQPKSVVEDLPMRSPQFRFRACGTAVNMRRNRPAAKTTDTQSLTSFALNI